MTRAEKIAKIVEHYGIGVQMGVAQEECAELIQAISKVRRRGAEPETLGHLSEEIADIGAVGVQNAFILDEVSHGVDLPVTGQESHTTFDGVLHQEHSVLVGVEAGHTRTLRSTS